MKFLKVLELLNTILKKIQKIAKFLKFIYINIMNKYYSGISYLNIAVNQQPLWGEPFWGHSTFIGGMHAVSVFPCWLCPCVHKSKINISKKFWRFLFLNFLNFLDVIDISFKFSGTYQLLIRFSNFSVSLVLIIRNRRNSWKNFQL